jgi:hypothetical protein
LADNYFSTDDKAKFEDIIKTGKEAAKILMEFKRQLICNADQKPIELNDLKNNIIT